MFKSLAKCSALMVKPNAAIYAKTFSNTYAFTPLQTAFQLKAMKFSTEESDSNDQRRRRNRDERRPREFNNNRENNNRQFNNDRFKPRRETQHKNVLIGSRADVTDEDISRIFGNITPNNVVRQKGPNGENYTSLTFEDASTAGKAIAKLVESKKTDFRFGNFRNISDSDLQNIQNEVTQPSSYVKFSRLPFSFGTEDLKNLLGEYSIEDASVGQTMGVVKCSTPEEAARLVSEKNGTVSNVRGIRLSVSLALPSDLDFAKSTQSKFVRVRNIPSDSKYTDIKEFFGELNPTRVKMIYSNRPESEGEVFGAIAEFSSVEDAEKALEKTQSKLGSRVISVTRSSKKELQFISKKQAEARNPKKQEDEFSDDE